jgi:hypothetical protein
MKTLQCYNETCYFVPLIFANKKNCDWELKPLSSEEHACGLENEV